MKNKLVINFGENKIVAEVYPTGVADAPYELCVYLCNNKDEMFQDICVVRPHHDYNRKDGVWETNNNFVDCLVWSDSDDEDYNDKHVISVYEWEENE